MCSNCNNIRTSVTTTGLLFLVIFVTTFVTSQSTLQDEEFQTGLLRAQCTARCLDKYGTLSEESSDDIYSLHPHKLCERHGCKQCQTACNFSLSDVEECFSLCENKTACVNSCHFLVRHYRQEYNTGDIRQDVITTPRVHCQNIPYSRHADAVCQENVASLYLKWEVAPKMAGESIVFIISARDMGSEDGALPQWQTLHMTSRTFTRINNLACGTKYQFKVTPVSRSGLAGKSRESEWVTTPTDPRHLKPPLNLRVVSQAIYKERPSAVIAWDEHEDASCYYRVYWMSKGASEEEIKVPPEFKYRISGLKFSTNYTVRLYSYDEKYRKGSKEDATTFFVTPRCLTATNYNFTLCAPEAPKNIRLAVLTPNSEDHDVEYVNISLSWDPPPHTNNGDEIIEYVIEWRKEPPIHAGRWILPHYDYVRINKTEDWPLETSITLYELHNHNQYSIMLFASTLGGQGEVAKRSISLGLPVKVEVTEATLEEKGAPLSIVRLNSAELVSVIVVPTGLTLTLVLVACIIVCKRKSKYTHYDSPRRCGPVEELNPIYDGIPCSIPCDDPGRDNYEIDYNCLDFVGVLGEGAFGKVVKAEYYKTVTDRGQEIGRVVAVKMLRDIYTADELRHFKLEIEAMKSLGNHPHLVSIIGCCLSGPKLCLVMDYCALGDLRNYLRKYREKMMYSPLSPYDVRPVLPSDDSGTPLVNSDSGISQESEDDQSVRSDEISEVQLLSYARQITMGMEFLEQRKFVHRDLAARNILLYDKRHLKISDFGLTRDVYETNMYQPTSARKLPYKWMALESLFSQEFTIKSDVWSFGIVMWEIVTLGGSPYPSIPLKDLYGLLNDGYRMERPENCSPSIYQIMLSCWHPCPVSRPSFIELKNQLESLLEEKQSYIDLSIEVSGDYFSSDSTTGSKHSSNMAQRQTEQNPDEGNANEIIEEDQTSNTQQPVDVHEHPDDSDQTDQNVSLVCSEQGDDEVFLDNDSRKNYCLFNLDNRLKDNNIDVDILTNNNKKCDCVLCINRDSIKSNRSTHSSVMPLKHKTSFRDSLKCIIDKVGKTNKLFSPLSRKRSVSLTDMDRGGKCTIHL